MSEHKKQRLMELGADALADALLDLASRDDTADDLVTRLIATPEENIKRFKAKMTRIKRSRRFIRRGESRYLAGELRELLNDLKAGVEDPRMGTELVIAFYGTDNGALGNSDDSDGYVGDVFRYDAEELFVYYAACCDDKTWIAKQVLKLNRKDDYGVRDTLINCAAKYLPEPNIRMMILSLQKLADKENDEYKKRHWLYGVESLARQIKDASLFEKTRLASWGDPPGTAASVDIARVYLESDDARTALSRLERIPEKETYQADERDRLLLDIHGKLANTEKQAEVAWRIFRRHRSAKYLLALLFVIGDDRRKAVIAGEIATIQAKKPLSLPDAKFLIEVDHTDEAANYLLDRADQLNGDWYDGLLPLAEVMETGGRSLAATVCYRALLDSIMRRAHTKTYTHGVRYLKKLDRLAKSIPAWPGIDDHKVYFEYLRQKHGRKSSFWSRYE